MLFPAIKEKGVRVTCKVYSHRLFLSADDIGKIGNGVAEVCPILCSPENQQVLWDNLDVIDVFATDHAPHTWEEKH